MPFYLTKARSLGLCAGLLLLGLLRSQAQTPDSSDTTYVQFNTSLGNIDVQMLSVEAPLNVANFMGYVNRGAYTNSIFHRSVSGFVIQGGGFTVSNGAPSAIAAGAPVMGEHDPTNNPKAFSNIQGTLALALSTGPNSGTNEWFFNLADNASALDNSSDGGPFTVFGVVADSSSLAVMNQIAALPTYDASSYFASLYGADFPSGAFTNLPLINFVSTPLATANFAVVTSILPYTPFSAWQTAFLNDPNAVTDSLPAATPQDDSTPNLLKYVCDVPGDQTMPSAERAKLPTSGMTKIGGKPYLTLTYHQRQNLSATGVSVSVLTSTDLVNWAAPTNATTTQTTATDGSNDLIIQVQIPAPASGSQFIRLSLTQ